MTHYIIPGAGYAKAYAKLRREAFGCAGNRFQQASRPRRRRPARRNSQNAWAKPDALLIYGACYEDDDGDIRLMLAEPTEEAEAA